MIPRYQDKNLDDTNRAKKRVLKNLQRSYTTPQIPTEIADDAREKYVKLVELFNSSLALLDESLGFTEGNLLVSYTRLNTTLSKIPSIYRQVLDISKTFVIDYINPDELSSLADILSDNMSRMFDLERSLDSLQDVLNDENMGTINRLFNIIDKELTQIAEMFAPMMRNHNMRQDNYVPKPALGEIGVRGSGGYRVLDYKRMR